MSVTPKHEKHVPGGEFESGSARNGTTPSGKPRGSRLARRARSFKDDFLEVLSQMRSSGAGGGGGSASARSGSPQSPKSRTPMRTPVRTPRQGDVVDSAVSTDKNPLRDLDAHVRQVEFALKHFNDVVGNKKLEVLPGNGTVILETVTLIHSTLKNSLPTEQSSLLTSGMNQVYQSVARLIRLCDDVLLHQEKALTKESAHEVVQCVQDAVQNLVSLAQDKIADRENVYKSKKSNEERSARAALNDRTDGLTLAVTGDLLAQRNSLPDIPLTPREKQILQQSVLERHHNFRNHSQSSESILDVDTGLHSPPASPQGSPPPKPPFPTRAWGSSSGEPPPLPPKQRQKQSLVVDVTSSATNDCDSTSASSGGGLGPSLLTGLEAVSLRSKSPEDTSSLLSASAGSLDSILNHSRDEEEELRVLMEPEAELEPLPGDSILSTHGVNDSLNGSGSPCCCCDSALQQSFQDSPVLRGRSFIKGLQNLSSSQVESGFASLCSSSQTFTSTSRSILVISQTQQRRQGQLADEAFAVSETDCDHVSPSGSSGTPPAIPEKTRNRGSRRDRLPSQYDNVPGVDLDADQVQLRCTMRAPEIQSQSHSHQIHVSSASVQHLCSGDSHVCQSSEGGEPPPLPPKKKHIMAYMEMFGNCAHPSSNDLLRHSVHSYNLMKTEWQEKSSMSSTQSCSFASVHLHKESLRSSSVEGSSPRPIALPPALPALPPALPPKRRRTWSVRSAASPPPASPPPNASLTPTTPRSAREEKKPEESSSPLRPEASLDPPTALSPSASSGPDASPTRSPARSPAKVSNPLEEIDVSRCLVWKKPQEDGPDVRGGSVDCLIVYATKANKNENETDFLYQEAFLTTYRTFVTPLELIRKLCHRHQHFCCSSELMKQRAAKESFSFLVRVVNDLTISDMDDTLVETLSSFVYQLLCSGDLTMAKALRVKILEKYSAKQLYVAQMSLLPPKAVSTRNVVRIPDIVARFAHKTDISKLIITKTDETSSNVDYPQQSPTSPTMLVTPLKEIEELQGLQEWNTGTSQIFHVNYTLFDFKSEQIAKQMTILDAGLFTKIEIPEVLIWAQEQNEERSPNLTRFTEHFNKMSYWARSRILEQKEARERERYVVKFIKIMKHLRKMNNFNSYLALLSAVDSSPVRRLEWQKHITEGLKEYCALIDSSSSFRAYRQALAETLPPCIPYIGLVLQDLTFVHIGNNDLLPDGTINFTKRWQQFNIVENMKRFKKATYGFKKQERIIAFFNNFDNCLCEEALWQISKSIKPK